MTKHFLAVALTAAAALSASSAELISESAIDGIVDRMTLEQKARMLVGTDGRNDAISHLVPGAAGWTYEIPSLGIPSINLADGPVGVRINPVPSENVTVEYDSQGIPVVSSSSAATVGGIRSYCTCFPSTTALAATWDVTAAALQGRCMADNGIGDRHLVDTDDVVFIGNSWGKSYHKLIGNASVKNGDTTHWEGIYTWFIQPVNTDPEYFSYLGCLNGKPAIFCHNKTTDYITPLK